MEPGGGYRPESWISDKTEEENPPRAKFKESPGGHRHDRTSKITRPHSASGLCSLSASNPYRVFDEGTETL